MPVTAARPIVERIAIVLKERLDLLMAGHSQNFRIREVIRPKRYETYKPQHLQIVVAQGDPERVPELDYPGNPPAVAHRVVFEVNCHLLPSEKDPTAIDEYKNTLEADAVRAITSAGTYWHTFSGLAIDAEIQPRQDIEADGGVDGFMLAVAVVYRVSERDPYERRG